MSNILLFFMPSYRLLLGYLGILCSLSGCQDGVSPSPTVQSRSFLMGFSEIPPRADVALAVSVIDLWSSRADAAIISSGLPWDSLIAGVPPETLISRERVGLANYYRSKGHRLWVYLDPANGLDRSGEAELLANLGRSITEPAIQQLFRRYVVVIDSMIHPDHLGLALETNLIRGLSSPGLYGAIRQTVNDAATDLRTANSTATLSVSVQVDYAWGRYSGGVFEGVEQDFTDFPFIEELGLSSYPYLAGFANPEDIPDDYYARIPGGHLIPLMVTEGGWTSQSFSNIITSTPEVQRRYIARQIQLLDAANAIAVFQLTFTDLDLPSLSLPPGSIIPYFAYLGLVDIDLNPKAALAVWDSTFMRPLQ